MRHIGQGMVVMLAVVGMMSGLVVASSQSAKADPNHACVAELGVTIPSAKDATLTPLITVHGLGGNQNTWSEGRPSIIGTLAEVEGLVVVKPFDYKSANDRWVTDPAIAQKLAKTIVCYSKLYGDKQVMLLAHSMGGLVVREALDWAAYGVFAREVTDHVITIGTPHTGALLANLEFSFRMAACKAPIGILDLTTDIDRMCRQAESGRATAGLSINSDQLATLPEFPKGISVKAIAGDAWARACAPWGCSEWVSTGGDLVVSVASATAEYTATGRGDGKKIFACNAEIAFSPLSNDWCEHSNMLQAPLVQAEVKKSIEEYLTSTRIPIADFFGLGLRLGPEWEVLGEADDPYGDGRKIVIPKDCDPHEYRPYCGGFVVVNMRAAKPMLPYEEGESCNYSQIYDNIGWTPPAIVGKIVVGGVEGEYFTQQSWCRLEDGERTSIRDTMHGWRFPSKGVLVYDSDIDRSAPYPGVERLLQAAVWQ